MRKNLLLKRRSWKTTFCEIFSPALFLSMLVLAYYLSDITYREAGIYARTTLNLGPLLDALEPAFGVAGSSASPGAGLGACISGGVGGGMGGGSGTRANSSGTSANSSGTSANSSDADACSAAGDSLNLWQLRSSLDSLLNGPLPVLPVDVYLAIGLTTQDALGPQNYKLLTEFDQYLQAFGNILTPGTLHLSPDTEEVRGFLNSTYARHPLLRNISVRVHADEDTAIESILNPKGAERTWGLINFRNLSAHHVDYSIRLNYSTVPNTNRITNWIARGSECTSAPASRP